MKKSLALAAVMLAISVLFTGEAISETKYRTLVDHKDYKEIARGYLGKYDGLIEGKAAYGVELDWIWLDPEVSFQKYKGLAIAFEDWVGMGYGERYKRAFAVGQPFRELFKGNVIQAPSVAALKSQAKPDYLILKGCVTYYNVSHAPFVGRLETHMAEIALIDGKTHKIVGKIIHKKHSKGSGVSEEMVQNVGALIKKSWSNPSTVGIKLQEFDDLK